MSPDVGGDNKTAAVTGMENNVRLSWKTWHKWNLKFGISFKIYIQPVNEAKINWLKFDQISQFADSAN